VNILSFCFISLKFLAASNHSCTIIVVNLSRYAKCYVIEMTNTSQLITFVHSTKPIKQAIYFYTRFVLYTVQPLASPAQFAVLGNVNCVVFIL
jgi:hypothetical protein